MNPISKSVYHYWFGNDGLGIKAVKARNTLWWQGSADTDYDIERRFGKLVEAAGKGAFSDWMQQAQPALALIIVNDQFPRNLYRGSGKAFSHDELALKYAKQLLNSLLFKELEPIEKVFALMPFEHSENIADQDLCVAEFTKLADSAEPDWQEAMTFYRQYAIEHRDIVAEFGRFPHRNKLLSRESTKEEIHYLENGAKTFGQ